MPTWPEAEIGNPAVITPFSACALGQLADTFAAGLSSASVFFTWPTANKGYAFPFRINNRPWVAKKAFCFNGSAVSGTVDMAIYDSRGNLLVSTGATTQAGTSVVQIIDCTDTTLNPGKYYMAISVSNTTAHLNRASGISVQALSYANCWTMASAHPLPSTWTFTLPDVSNMPIFGFSNFTV